MLLFLASNELRNFPFNSNNRGIFFHKLIENLYTLFRNDRIGFSIKIFFLQVFTQ